MLNGSADIVILAWMWLTSNLLSVPIVLIIIFTAVFYFTQLPWRQYGAGRGQMLLYAALIVILVPSVIQTFFLPTLTQWWEYSILREPAYVISRFAGHLLGIAAVVGQAYLVVSRRHRPLHLPAELEQVQAERRA